MLHHSAIEYCACMSGCSRLCGRWSESCTIWLIRYRLRVMSQTNVLRTITAAENVYETEWQHDRVGEASWERILDLNCIRSRGNLSKAQSSMDGGGGWGVDSN